MSISERILAAKAARQAATEPVQYEAFGEAYELVKELVVQGGYNPKSALAYHNVKVTLAEFRALQVAANERDQYTIAR
jgi:hypothetical protein